MKAIDKKRLIALVLIILMSLGLFVFALLSSIKG